jgi:hypothetical protein
MQALLAEYPPEMVRIAALVRRTLNLQKGEKVQLRLMLKTGLLGGQVRSDKGKILLHSAAVEIQRSVLWSMCGGIAVANLPSLLAILASSFLTGFQPSSAELVTLRLPSQCRPHRGPSANAPVQDVRFQTKAGRVQNSGRLGAGGSITCFCKACGAGGREVSASEFEEHSGSKDRRPADGIFLECAPPDAPCHAWAGPGGCC